VIRIAVPVPLAQLFDYHVPAELPLPPVGGRVRVPFARRNLVGICLATDPGDAHGDTKAITEVLDSEPVFSADLFALAQWMADYYLHPIGEVLAAMLPAQARQGAPLDIVREERWSTTDVDGNLSRAPRQLELLCVLKKQGGSATTSALYELGFARSVIKGLAAKGFIKRALAAASQPRPFAPMADTQKPDLTAEQSAAIKQFDAADQGFTPGLLEGVTGSGKTEIYLRLIEARCADTQQAQQALVLVPEIALTPQTVARFKERFGDNGAVECLHSNLNDTERLQTWLKCRAGETRVVIGTRSAVLTPFKNLQLIVVDEEHDGSFKQQDGLRYSARDVAVKRAQRLGIPLLLGSATPALESLNNAHRGRYTHLHLKKRAGGAQMPAFNLLDIRGQTLNHGMSNELIRILKQHLDRDSQALVFLNRRGYAPSYLCASCGWQAQCPNCDMRMTLHRSPSMLACHHCGRRESVPKVCGKCTAEQLIAVGLGTQRTEVGLAQLFPQVPLIRIDRDTTRSQRQMQGQLDTIQQGERAILLGTQMLAKGHHFPKVTLVAVINADAGFLSADFRAPERTAQLITQVAGRAGRAETPGEVWIQTYQPDGNLLRSLIEEGYSGFAARELAVREAAGLPPFRPMALIRAESPDGRSAHAFLQSLVGQLPNDLEVLGPAPAPIARVANRYRHQLMVLADNRAQIHAGLALLRTQTPAARGGLRWSVDIDPYDTF
jgi:primosomal protein N' (replication factor Y)